MDKKKLSETDIRTKFITPAIVEAGWDLHTQLREEFGTNVRLGELLFIGYIRTSQRRK